ncbi:MAG: hypothetical protein ACYDH4_07570 [Candidatus Cryosericum sp.]
MNQTVMIEAVGSGVDARTQALNNVFEWTGPQQVEGRRLVVLLGDLPAGLDVVERTVRALSGAARIDLAARSLAGYDEAYRNALARLLGERGNLIEMISGEYESLTVPTRFYARQLHKMETPERRYVKQAFVSRCLAEADLFVVVRGLELNRFSGIHGIFATVLDCLATKTRTEVLSYAAYGLMGEALLDVWSAIPGSFLFGILDGERACEETYGRTVETGVILAGIDPGELDGYALIATGGKVSWSPFSSSASVRVGGGRHARTSDVACNITLDELRARVPPGFWQRPPFRSMFGALPVIRFSRRPGAFDTLACPMGAIEEGLNGVPRVRHASCVGCWWCLKEYAEASVSRR